MTNSFNVLLLHPIGTKIVEANTQNKCSVLHLKDCSEVTKLDSEVSLLHENFHFLRSGHLSSRGLAVQLRSDNQTKAGQPDRD